MRLDQIDPYRLAANGTVIDETEQIADFPRLLEALADDEGQARWQAAFSQSGDDIARPVKLTLTGTANCNVPCVRCLAGLPMILKVDREFKLVKEEATAAALDAQDSERDVMAVAPPWNLAELVEDEFLLALPLMPRHENCHVPEHADSDDPGPDSASTERQFPFADLASKIKGGSSGSNDH